MQRMSVCSRCGTPAESGEAFCGECGQSLFSKTPPPLPTKALPGSQNRTPAPPISIPPHKIRTYLVPAILSVFFCFPIGIPAIVFAVQVKARAAASDIKGATDASRNAKVCSFIGIGFSLLVFVLYAAFFLLVAFAASAHRR